MKKAKYYCEDSYNAFKKEYELFFRRHFPDLFKDEAYYYLKHKRVMITDIKELLFCEFSPTYQNLPYDLNFHLAIVYQNYYEFDIQGNQWKRKEDRYLQKHIESPYFNGIFRNTIDFPYYSLIERLLKKKINFVCLRKYEGGLTEKEFETKLMEKGIYVYFIK